MKARIHTLIITLQAALTFQKGFDNPRDLRDYLRHRGRRYFRCHF